MIWASRNQCVKVFNVFRSEDILCDFNLWTAKMMICVLVCVCILKYVGGKAEHDTRWSRALDCQFDTQCSAGCQNWFKAG